MKAATEMIENYSCKHMDKLERLAKPLAETFGINYFFYWYISYDHKSCLIGTKPELMEDYFAQGFHLLSPFFLHVRDVKTGLYFYDSVKSQQFQTSVNYLETRYDAKHRCLLTQKDADGLHIFGFSTPSKEEDSLGLYLYEEKALRKFTSYCEMELGSILYHLRHELIDLKPAKKETNSPVELPAIYLSHDKLLSFMKEIDQEMTNLYLSSFTSSELACSRLLLMGKTAQEIATELRLSVRTIEHRIERIKDKLCCQTRSELISHLHKLSLLHLL